MDFLCRVYLYAKEEQLNMESSSLCHEKNESLLLKSRHEKQCVTVAPEILTMDSDSDRADSYYTAFTHFSPRKDEFGDQTGRDRSEIFLRIKHLLREFSSIKREILDLKAHVGEPDDTHRYMRTKVVPRTAKIQRVTTSRKMNFTVLCEICRKIIENGSLDGLGMAELQFLQESAYVAGIRHSTTEVELIEPSSNLDVCVRRIEYLHSVLNTAKENIRSLRMDLKVK